LSEKINHKQISIQKHISGDIVAFADYNMTNTIVRNLLTNAIKFTNPGGHIYVSALINDDNMVEISIKDDGIGIDEKVVDKLFRIDHQFKVIGTAGEMGTGLGLKLCSDLILKNKGRIWIKSSLNEGTCIYFTLPQFYE
ncbi:sensor histidine kinase, partial [Candidatus Magnetomorum sp. HK-1]